MPNDWDREIDLLVIGGGGAGLATAVVGAHEGLSVLVCEKSELLGGTTATSGAAVWIPGSTQSKATSAPSDIGSARVYLDGEVGGHGDPALREVFLQTGAEALAYFEARTDVKFKANNPYPDYHPDRPGGATGGRALTAVEIDGGLLGDDLALVRPPIPEFMLFGGMMFARAEIQYLIRPWASLKAFGISARAVLAYLAQRLRYPRGTRLLLGNALIARLLLSLRKAGGEVAVNARLRELVRGARGVEGAIVELDGKPVRIRARRGVAVATGGFASNPKWRKKVLPQAQIDNVLTFTGANGEGIDAALLAGGDLNTDHASPFFWMPASIMNWSRGKSAVFPHIRDRPKPGLIAVDQAGRRFVNEANSYQDFVSAMLDHPSGPITTAYLICDRDFLHNYGLGVVYPVWQVVSYFTKRGYLVSGSTLQELATRIGVDPEGLEASVARHNEDAITGVDAVFGKGSTALNRFNGDAENKPNPCLKPIAKAPFFALPVHPTPIGTSLGLRTNADAQVVGTDGAAIEGLYAVGNDMSSIMGGTYPGPGITLGPAIVFAYRAGRHAARSTQTA